MWAKVGLLLVVALLHGCSSSEARLSACEPLAAETSEVKLETIVGAGEGADGTVYVVDRSEGELRAFISDEGALYRQRVSGTGEDSVDGDFVLVSLNELDPAVTLQVTTDADGNVRMGVVVGPLENKTFVIGEEGEELTLLADAEVKALPIRNYPADTVVEYFAELADSRSLVVLRPRDFSAYDQFRLFLGPPNRLEERRLTSVTRQRDGGSTELEFEVDGDDARASFPIESTADGFTPGDPSMTIAGDPVDITLLDTMPPLADASYYCLD